MMRSRVALGVLVVALGGCGGQSSKTTVTVTASATTQTTAPDPASPSTATATTPTTLSSQEKATLNRGIDKFNTAAGASDAADAASAATDEALLLTQLAARHVGSDLSSRLVAASDGWTALSEALIHGNQQAVNQAEQTVQKVDAQIGVSQ